MNQAGLKPRVCLMTTSHPVRYSRFFNREAVSLVRAGYDVRIVGLGPDGRQSEAGVGLVGVRRRTKRQLIADVAKTAEGESCDIYHCLDPWTLRSGLRFKRRDRSRKLVYESSEWFPKMWLDRKDRSPVVRWLGWLAVTRAETRACREADAIIETNATRAERFRRHGPTPLLVPNYPPLDLLPEPLAERKPWFAWTGLVSRPRGFDRLLEALVPVVRQFTQTRLQVIGEFDPRDDIESWAREFVRTQGIEANVEFFGPLSYEAMFAALRPCLAGLILFQPERGNDFTGQPNKLFEFMGSGLAVIASDFPEIAPVVRDTGSGWLVDPRSPEMIAEALSAALSDPDGCRKKGDAGRRAVISHYHWGIAERSLLDLYERLSQ